MAVTLPGGFLCVWIHEKDPNQGDFFQAIRTAVGIY
jgi:hypothetical protein